MVTLLESKSSDLETPSHFDQSPPKLKVMNWSRGFSRSRPIPLE